MNTDEMISTLKMISRLDAAVKSHNFKPKGHNKEIYTKSKNFRNQRTLRKK